jgi:hypothetical protein
MSKISMSKILSKIVGQKFCPKTLSGEMEMNRMETSDRSAPILRNSRVRRRRPAASGRRTSVTHRMTQRTSGL